MPCVPLSHYYTGHSLLTSSFVKSQSGSFRGDAHPAAPQRPGAGPTGPPDPGANVVAEQTGQYASVSCSTP